MTNRLGSNGTAVTVNLLYRTTSLYICHVIGCISSIQVQPFEAMARPPADLLTQAGSPTVGPDLTGPDQGGGESTGNGTTGAVAFLVKCCQLEEIFNPQSGAARCHFYLFISVVESAIL